MDLSDVQNIIFGEEKVLFLALPKFVEKHNKTLCFPELNFELRKDLWNSLFQQLHIRNTSTLNINCLAAIRILSRDKNNLDELIQENWVETLLIYSHLKISSKPNEMAYDYDVIAESLKCLCNLIFNSKVVQDICFKNDTLESITKCLFTERSRDIPYDVKYFDMKFLFLITALCSDVRLKIIELDGIQYMIQYLVITLNGTSNTKCDLNTQTMLLDHQIKLLCEILKVLFNLTFKSNLPQEDTNYVQLVGILNELLRLPTQTAEKKMELHNHVINLLTALPTYCLKELITVCSDCTVPKEKTFDSHNMETLYSLLMFLRSKFDGEEIIIRQQELLSPVLSVLLKMAKSSRIARKYLKLQILPPLKDVYNRPEKGCTLRNSLCRLLTTPVTQVKDLTAELLFVICKENVTRMVKYTGYGNAAGLFANRGLMGNTSNEDITKYSSESEDSDTEEYKIFKNSINPVVGCYEPPHSNNTEEMSEEQKEYEAMKLVQLMENLTKNGIVQPCRIGQDGRPEPIDHVLQLQEELPNQQINKNSNS